MIHQAYGAFFLLRNRLSHILLLAATFVDWQTGLGGLVGGLGVLISCRLFDYKPRADQLDLVNGCLLGLLMGATYQADARSALFLLASGPIGLLATRLCEKTLEARGLPILCAPFALAGPLMMSAATSLYLVLRAPKPFLAELAAPPVVHQFFQALGGVYLAPYPLAGILVFLALTLSSRYLALLSVLGFAASEVVLHLLGVPPGTLTRFIAGSGAILSSLVLGGLFSVPSLGSAVMACLSGLASAALYLGLVGPLARLGLVPLAWPFLLVSWGCLMALAGHRAIRWQRHPSLPEDAVEREAVARARGCGSGSIALKAPFEGSWMVYQSFDGPHTHQGPWRYALDFIRCQDGVSYHGQGAELSDYYCFDCPVHSPAHGTVVECRDDIADNLPGEVNLEDRFGNYVLIALGEERYLVLAHLSQGSVKVRPGQLLKPGEVVGRCGNSGRSPQPHLHLHVQRGATLGSATLPFHFSGVLVDENFSLMTVPGVGQQVTTPRLCHHTEQSLRLPVGRRLIFCLESPDRQASELRTLQTRLDLSGQFWLQGRDGAELALYQDSRVLTCFDRNSKPDALLDLFALALGVTPLMIEPGQWKDTPPARLLSSSLLGFRSCGFSTYRRTELDHGRYIQEGHHCLRQGGKTILRTKARFSLERGLRELTLYRGEQAVLRARVVGLGMCSDQGTPGWEVGVPETGLLQTS